MIVVYCPRPSKGAHTLVDWFNENGHVAVRFKSGNFLRLNPTLVLGWGEAPPSGQIRTLNARAGTTNKYNQLAALAQASVPAPRVRRTPQEGWLARRWSHQDGDDLQDLTGPADFYAEMVPSTHEYRMNVFNGEVFRTGVKIPKKGVTPHPFIRTGSGGWTWTYDQDTLNRTGRPDTRRTLREAAVAAVQALHYDFGAVDVGRRTDGTPVVYEVNSAPALEGSDLARWGNIFLEYERSPS